MKLSKSAQRDSLVKTLFRSTCPVLASCFFDLIVDIGYLEWTFMADSLGSSSLSCALSNSSFKNCISCVFIDCPTRAIGHAYLRYANKQLCQRQRCPLWAKQIYGMLMLEQAGWLRRVSACNDMRGEADSTHLTHVQGQQFLARPVKTWLYNCVVTFLRKERAWFCTDKLVKLH